jgi:transcription antitermination factor NusG
MLHVLHADIFKAHIKSHFRKDAKTGKLIFIHDYDDKRHKDILHVRFHKGDKVKVTGGKHAGETGVVTSYSDKYHEIGVKVDAGTIKLVKPDAIEHAITSASPTPAAPSVPSMPIDFDDVKRILGVLGLGYSTPEMVHEAKRVNAMTDQALITRIGKIKSDQKLYNFYRAAAQAMKVKVADAIRAEMEKRAQAKQAAKPPAGDGSDKKPDQPAGQTPQASSQASSAISEGDAVEILTGKFQGEKGVVTKIHDKYGIRVRVTKDGKVFYPEFNPKKNGLKKEGVSGPGAPAAKTSADEAAKIAEDALANKKPSDFFREKHKAYAVAPQNYKDIAHALGILPLDDKAAEYMQRNIDKLAKTSSWIAGGSGGYQIPQWAKNFNGSWFADRLIEKVVDGKDDNPEIKIAKLWDVPDETWKKAGYEVDRIKRIKSDVDAVLSESKKQFSQMNAGVFFDNIVKALGDLDDQWANRHGLPRFFVEKGITLDKPLSEIYDETLGAKEKGFNVNVDREAFLQLASALAGARAAKSPEKLTARDCLIGYKRDYLDVPGSSSFFDKFGKTLSFKAAKSATADSTSYTKKEKPQDIISNVHTHSTWLYHKEAIEALLRAKKSSTSYSWRTGIFSISPTTAHNAAEKAISKSFDSYQELKTMITANEVITRAHSRSYNAAAYKPAVFHVDATRGVRDGRELGLKIFRRKGTAEEVGEKIASEYRKKKGKNIPDAPLHAVFKSVDEKTFKMVERKFGATWDKSTHGGFYFRIHGVYQVGGMDVYGDYKKIEDSKDNTRFMYHGTDFAAASSIVKGGFLVPKRVKAGRMLGNGVYVTPVSSKASQYLGERFKRTIGTRGIIFVNKTSLGTQHNHGSRSSYGIPVTADSVYINKGQAGILNEEHCVRNPKGVLPTFWVDVELTSPQTRNP